LGLRFGALYNVAMHPLDNPAWTALTTHQADIALVDGMARRFPPEMTYHGAVALLMPPAWQSLARLSARNPVALFSFTPLALPPGWTITRQVESFQMVHEDGKAANAIDVSAVAELKEADLPEMHVVYEATRPGRKMSPRNQKLGMFLGIRSHGRLVAMAGLRMHLPGYREITTVGTLPDFEGRGYATALVAALVERIHARNECPFLTARTDNLRAIEVYRRLGFRERTQLHSTTMTCTTS
jgi:ribosomal protein S18 acetylase RimI-like enzyme